MEPRDIGFRRKQGVVVALSLLAAIAWLGLAVSVSHANLAFIPAMALLFVAGRATFWVGYLLHPTARAFGMTMTVLPTVVVYGCLLARCLRHRGAGSIGVQSGSISTDGPSVSKSTQSGYMGAMLASHHGSTHNSDP
jgi:hypothetical protein